MKWLCIVLTFCCSVHLSRASLLDVSFDIGTGANGIVEQVLELPDGKILICGNFTSFNGVDRGYIARLHPDGSVDTSFKAHPSYWVRNMAVQKDGRIVIGGYFTMVSDTPRNLIARLNPDGSLDTGFDPGTGADVIIAGGIDGNITPFVFWIAIQEDGKILITGNFREYNGDSSTGLARLNPDGSRDSTFAMGSGLNSWGRSIKIASNGQIYVSGWFDNYNGFSANRLVRINPDGSPDDSFRPFYGDRTAIYSVVELPDGKLITSGHSRNYDGLFHENVVRLNSDGSVDPEWEGSTNERTECLHLLPNGELILAGHFNQVNGQRRTGIGRLHPNGSLDDKLVVEADNFIWTVAPARDNKLLISGGFTTVDGVSRRGVARLHVPESGGPISPPEPDPPILTEGRIDESGFFRVKVSTTPGRTYTLEAAGDPDGPWGEVTSARAQHTTLDLEEATQQPWRFYRVIAR